MNYQASLQRLLTLDPAPKWGIERMHQLIELLHHPEQHYQILHVAGTNGKGSTCAFLDAILEQAGIARGRYTSPHLQCARERILINGQFISEPEFSEVETIVYNACQKLPDVPTFFERMTAMALLAFQRANIQVAILEVGLGGRLDATNIVTPIVCGITRIDIDHAHILGEKLAQIATEKAGIIKSHVPIVTDQQEPEVIAVIKATAEQKKAPLWQIGSDIVIDQTNDEISVFHQNQLILPKSKLSLQGPHQTHNAAVAVSMIELSGLVPDLNARRLGIETAKWPGRYETIHQDPLVVLDGAHNPAGTKRLIETIQQDKRLTGLPLTLLVGMTDGHDIIHMAQAWKELASRIQHLIITQANVPRALSPTQVAEAFSQENFFPILQDYDSQQATQQALGLAKESQGAVIVAGSLYLVGEVRSYFTPMLQDKISPHY